MPGLLPIVGLMFQLARAPVAGEVATLVRSASELLHEGQPRKAMVLLQRARSLDSSQSEADRLMDLCRAKLGLWVSSETRADWVSTEDRLEQVARDFPDSMADVARKYQEDENLGMSVRIYWLLASSHAATPAYMNAYKDARTRQEMKVAFHLELARLAISRGLLSDASSQWRMAYSARPEDPLLREKVEASDESMRAAMAMFEKDLRGKVAVRDMNGALETLRRIRIAFPEEARFRKAQDSLQDQRRTGILKRIEEINALVDVGNEQAAMGAMEAMGEADPQEPILALAQDALQKRIQARRKKTMVDSLARAVDEAIQSGDAGKAEAVFADLQKIGMTEDLDARLRPRIDSLRSAERSANTFHEAMASARRSLARKDVNAGRAGLQKALVAKPDNPVARKILSDLSASHATPVESRGAPAKPFSLDDAASQKVRNLLLSGVIAYRAGEYEKAMSQWRQALVLDPNCVQAQRYLANVGKKQARLR